MCFVDIYCSKSGAKKSVLIYFYDIACVNNKNSFASLGNMSKTNETRQLLKFDPLILVNNFQFLLITF